jgi:hypothetical protein
LVCLKLATNNIGNLCMRTDLKFSWKLFVFNAVKFDAIRQEITQRRQRSAQSPKQHPIFSNT